MISVSIFPSSPAKKMMMLPIKLKNDASNTVACTPTNGVSVSTTIAIAKNRPFLLVSIVVRYGRWKRASIRMFTEDFF